MGYTGQNGLGQRLKGCVGTGVNKTGRGSEGMQNRCGKGKRDGIRIDYT